MDENILAEIKVDVLMGPIVSRGFRRGYWPFIFRGEEYRVYTSIPYKTDIEWQRGCVRERAYLMLERLGIIENS